MVLPKKRLSVLTTSRSRWALRFVQIRMISQLDFGELFERDIQLSTDTMPPFQNACTLARFDVQRLALVMGLGTGPISPAIQAEHIVPVMIAARLPFAHAPVKDAARRSAVPPCGRNP
jgi:hypothetical protein